MGAVLDALVDGVVIGNADDSGLSRCRDQDWEQIIHVLRGEQKTHRMGIIMF